jgi:hypothetical protein
LWSLGDQTAPNHMLKRSSKTFVISTETPNNKGFRVRNAGIDLSQYPDNPLLLWMHQRPSKENDYKSLPLGNGEEVELKEDGKLYGRPCFDPSDPFAMQIYEKVENGTIRMASAGLFPVEWAYDGNGDLWLEKSRLVEWSIADIGSNPDALAVQLYDENDDLITLSQDYITTHIPQPKPISNMKLIQLSADAVLPLIGLAADAKPEEVQAKINELVTLSSTQKTQIETLSSEKTTAEAKVVELSSEVDTLKKAATAEKINGLVDGAVAAKKITADQKDAYVKLAAADFDATKSILDSMKSNPSVKSAVEEAKETAGAEYEKLSWDDMDKSGQLIKLKAEFPDIFKAKYKAKYGSDFPG